MGAAATALFDEPQGLDPDIKIAVLEQLERIRNDKLFRDTTRMKRFLSYVVHETLEGRSKRLKGYAIGLEVFDRPDDFDSQADTIVRVQAGQLRRRLDLYYANAGKIDPVRFVIPKGQYAPTFEMRRVLPNEENSEDPDEKETDKIVSTHLRSRPGIAVFTFENLSHSNQPDFFAEGLTAEIINALVQFRYLRIVSSTPSSDAKTNKGLEKDFIEKYDVQFILTGSVRRIDDVFRVSVSLISTKTGEHVFTRIFDKQYAPNNLFDIQEEIASYTAAKVAAPFGVVNRFNRRSNLGRLESMPAYEALLEFYDLKLLPTTLRVKSLLEKFDHITETQPGYSSAWAIKALLKIYLCTQSIPSEVKAGRLEEALNCARKATAIDSDNALGFMALYQAYYHSGSLDMGERMAQRAMALNPNDYSMLAYYSITNAYRNNPGRAMAYHNAALRLIDRPPIWFFTTSTILGLREKRFEDVDVIMQDKITTSHPISVQYCGLALMGHLGDSEKATKFIRESRALDPNFDQDLVDVFLTWQPDETLQDVIFSGLKLAGLNV